MSGFKALLFCAASTFVLSSCERIPELERKSALGKTSDSSRKLVELRKWIWSCRGVSTSLSLSTKGRKELGERIEEFVDYFQSKGLSTVSSEGPSTLLGTAILWKESGYLLAPISSISDVKDIECSNGLLPWFKASVKGFDRGLDLAVLKLEASATSQIKNYIHWVERSGSPSLDENLSVVSAAFPGQIDRMAVQLQPFLSTMHTGIDEDLLLFLPPVPDVAAGGLLVDSQFRVVGYLLPHQNSLWGAALSAKRAGYSVNSIIENGKVIQPYTGLKLRFQVDEGFIVQQIEVGSPAYRAGLRVDDVLLKWNKRDLKQLSDWQEVTTNEIGKTIPLTYRRVDKVFEAQLLLLSAE